MGWARPKKRKKKNLVPNSVHTRPGDENSEKNRKKIQKFWKTPFQHYFLPKREEIGRKSEKNFSPEFHSYLTRARKFKKKIAKKFKKLKNLFPALFLAKNGWDRPKKWKKNFSPEFRLYSTQARKFRKKLQKYS